MAILDAEISGEGERGVGFRCVILAERYIIQQTSEENPLHFPGHRDHDQEIWPHAINGKVLQKAQLLLW